MHIYNTLCYMLVCNIYLAIHLHTQCFILFLRHVMTVLPRDAPWLVPSRADSPVSGRSRVWAPAARFLPQLGQASLSFLLLWLHLGSQQLCRLSCLYLPLFPTVRSLWNRWSMNWLFLPFLDKISNILSASSPRTATIWNPKCSVVGLLKDLKILTSFKPTAYIKNPISNIRKWKWIL